MFKIKRTALMARHDCVSARYETLPPSQPALGQKLCKDPVTRKTAQTTVTSVYQAHIAGFWHTVTVLWCKNLMNYSLSIYVDSVGHDLVYTCKIDLKPWHFWTRKGYKTFEVDGNLLEVYWDFRSAKFSGSPEPCSDFYVALVYEEEVVLLLGDYKKKAYKRTRAAPTLVDALMFYKKENVFGKKSFSTSAKFDERKREHEIIVESSTSGPKDPEMWISIDGIVLVHVKNLQWKFRGNQTVLVDKQLVQVYWDVHAWLFCAPGTSHGYGLFIFKSGKNDADSDVQDNSYGDGSECSGDSRYYSTQSCSKGSHFCLFLYAWKIE